MIRDHAQNEVYYEDDQCVVVYDGYPKSKYHLLLLPKPKVTEALEPCFLVCSFQTLIPLLDSDMHGWFLHVTVDSSNALVPGASKTSLAHTMLSSLTLSMQSFWMSSELRRSEGTNISPACASCMPLERR